MRATRFRIFPLLIVPALLFGVGLVLYLPSTAYASIAHQDAAPTPDPLTIGNDTCLSCHEKPGQTMQFENGDILDLTVYPQEYATSIHGKLDYACVQCHRTIGTYPHPAVTSTSLREFTINMNKACGTCHEPQVLLTQDSVHAVALASGVREAAVCTDCHGSHEVQQWNDPDSGELLQTARLRIPQACANCHNDIYQKYAESVHGAALYDENNNDVPTCIDCHGVHNIENPTTANFRLFSPRICAKCHTDTQIMQKYGLSTDVLDTYVADFHGTTVMVFEKLAPDAETNKPVCYDCHGIHDIKRTDDPTYGLHLQENLMTRCQTCHPEATANFPTAWLSHYIPSPDKNQLVYYVEMFYKFFIPGVLGPMFLLVALDVGHTLYKKYRKDSGKQSPETEHLPVGGSSDNQLVQNVEQPLPEQSPSTPAPAAPPSPAPSEDDQTGEEVDHA